MSAAEDEMVGVKVHYGAPQLTWGVRGRIVRSFRDTGLLICWATTPDAATADNLERHVIALPQIHGTLWNRSACPGLRQSPLTSVRLASRSGPGR